jgi:uncharacterized surface protein with fasciclin (FAS1) repeats
MCVQWARSHDAAMTNNSPLRSSSITQKIDSEVRAAVRLRPLYRIAAVAIAGVTFAACSTSDSGDTTAANVSVAAAESPAEDVSADTLSSNAADTTAAAPSPDDVFTTIEGSGKYPTFVKLVTQAGLADTLRSGGPFTVAVPNEAAFAALPPATLEALGADPVELARVLKYHVVPGLVSASPGDSGPAPTMEGSTIDVQFTATKASINDATILTSAMATANGAYVAIDKVLLPPTAAK